MQTPERFKQIGFLCLALFLIPLIGWLTGHYVETRYEAQFRNLVINTEKLITAQEYETRGLSYISVCRNLTKDDGNEAKKICSFADEVHYAKDSSLLTAAIGVFLFALIVGGRIIAGTNRRRMSLVFGPLVRVVMLLLAISVLAQGALFVYSVYTLEAAAIQRVHGGLLAAVGIGALVACWVLLRYSIGLLKSEPMVLRGVLLDKSKQRGIYDLTNKIAAKLKAEPPDFIIVGLEPNFFVTASKINLIGHEGLIQGRTLFISLSLLRVFGEDELASVIGHELGHFRGEDVAYSMKFAPTYARLGKALGNLGSDSGSAADIAKLPAIVALGMCFMEFAAAERTIGRERELLADRAGAEAADGFALARALVKVSFFAPHWARLSRANVDALAEGRMFTNLSQTYAQVCHELTENLDWAAAQQELGKYVQPHPIDTHPPLQQRLENLGVTLTDISPQQLVAPERAAITLIEDAQTIEESLSNLEAQWLIAIGAVVTPKTESPEAPGS